MHFVPVTYCWVANISKLQNSNHFNMPTDSSGQELGRAEQGWLGFAPQRLGSHLGKLEWPGVTGSDVPEIIWSLHSDSWHVGWKDTKGVLSQNDQPQLLCMVLTCSLGLLPHGGWEEQLLREHLEGENSKRTRCALHDLLWSSCRSRVTSLLLRSIDYQWVTKPGPDSREGNGVLPLDEEGTRTRAEEQVEWKILLLSLSNKTICHTYDQGWIRTQGSENHLSGEIGKCVHIPLRNFYCKMFLQKHF